MNRRGLRTLLALSVLGLTACAQQSDLHQIQHEIKSLNQDMRTLSQQAVMLSRQNALNAHSTQGVYLLPDTGAPTLLESQIGVLKVSLTSVVAVEDGAQVTLSIQESTLQPLPAFSAMIEWKVNTDTESAMANGQQSFIISVHSATPSLATITFILPDVTPETLSWVRIHHITATHAATTSPAREFSPTTEFSAGGEPRKRMNSNRVHTE